MPDPLKPTAKDRLAVALRAFTVPLGIRADEAVELAGRVGGMAAVTVVDDDFAALPSEADAGGGDQLRHQAVPGFEKTLKAAKLKVCAVSVDFESQPMYHGGALLSGDAEVRAASLQKALRAMDLARELGAKVVMVPLERDSLGSARVDHAPADKRLRQSLVFMSRYSADRGYGLRIALDPTGRSLGPAVSAGRAVDGTAAGALAFLASLKPEHPVGAVAHTGDRSSRADPAWATHRAAVAGRLAHAFVADCGSGDRADDAPIGSSDPVGAMMAAGQLEHEKWVGYREVAVSPTKSRDADELVAEVRHAATAYLRFRERARAWASDAEVKRLRRRIARHAPDLERLCESFSKSKAETLLGMEFDPEKLAGRASAELALRRRTLEIALGAG